MIPHHRWTIFLCCVAACLAGGCANTDGPGGFTVPDGGYAAAFDAARTSLIDRRFDLERVDARAGVITTKTKSTAGLATPWDTEQSSLDQEVEDLLNGQQRRVRITFEPLATEGGFLPSEDIREFKGPLSARVEVVIERIHRSGWQIQTTAVRFSDLTRDPELSDRGMWPTYAVPFSQDPKLASRIAIEIEKKTTRQGITPQTAIAK